MRRNHEIIRFIRCIGVLILIVFALSCRLPETSIVPTNGDFIRSEAIGGAGEDIGYGVCVDSSGNVYVTGHFNGTVDFDPGPGVSELDAIGGTDAVFINKLDSNGGFVWAKAISGPGNGFGTGISVDSSGNVFVTGDFWDTVDFDPGAGTVDMTSAGQSDVFVLKLDSSGDYVWARSMGGATQDEGFGITLNSSGDVLFTGFFSGTADFDPGAGTTNLISADGTDDIFICKLNSGGNLAWVKAIGGDSSDYGFGIDTDSLGNVYTTGSFAGTIDFDPGGGTFNLTNTVGLDIFVSKLDSNGNFVWAKGIGGTPSGEGHGIDVDTLGNVHTTGYFEGTVDFDPGAGTFNLISGSGQPNAFVSKLDSSGDFVWAGALGGDARVYGYGISVDTSGNAYTTGKFRDTADFDPGPGTYDLISDGSYDIFISKLDSSGDFVWAKAMSGSNDEAGNGVCVDTSSNVYVTGSFIGTVDFDPGPDTFNMVSDSASEDIFIVKLK